MKTKKMYHMHIREMDPDECPHSENRMVAAIILFETPNPEPTIKAEGKLMAAKLVKDVDEAKKYFEYYLREHTIMQEINLIPIYAAKKREGK